MTRTELLEEIAKQPLLERLPLYVAAMNIGRLTYQEIQVAMDEAVVTRPVAKKAVSKHTPSSKPVVKAATKTGGAVKKDGIVIVSE